MFYKAIGFARTYGETEISPDLKIMCKKSENTGLIENVSLSDGSDRGQESRDYLLSQFGSLCEMRE